MKRGLLAVALVACSSAEPFPDGGASPQPGSVTVTLLDESVIVVRGQSTTIRLSIASLAADEPTLTIGLGPLPAGLSATPITWSTSDALQPTLVMTASPDAPQARFAFEVRAFANETIVGSSTGEVAVSNFAGSPDPAFGTGGVVKLQTGTLTQPIGIAPAANGAFVIGGFDSNLKRAVAIRMLADGTIDDTYGQNGVAAVPPTLGALYATSMAASSDGRIAVALTTGNGTTGAAVTLDANGNTLTTTSLPFIPTAIAWDGDGLFVGGTFELSYIDASQTISTMQTAAKVASLEVVSPNVVLAGGADVQARATITKWSFSSGNFTADTTYGQNGTATLPVTMQVTALARDPSGHTLAAIAGMEAGIARLDPTGVPDDAYGNHGVAISAPTANALAGLVSMSAGDALFVTCTPSTNSSSVMGVALLAHLTADGQADATFGTYGGTMTSIATGTRPAGVALDGDATHAYVTGTVDDNGGAGGYVARYRLAP